MSNNPNYARGYLDGYSDAEKHYTSVCDICGTPGIRETAKLCLECESEPKASDSSSK
jgi:hypothetical protein